MVIENGVNTTIFFHPFSFMAGPRAVDWPVIQTFQIQLHSCVIAIQDCMTWESEFPLVKINAF